MPPVSGSSSMASDQQASTAARAMGSRSEAMSGEPEPFPDAAVPRADQPVGENADEGDRQAGDEAAAGIGFGEGLEHLLAEIAGADHRRDDVHGEGEEHHLVDAEHDLR